MKKNETFSTAVLSYTEEELVERLIRHDEKAFEVLIDRYGGIVYTILYGYTTDKNTVDDIFQDVMIKIYQHIHSFRGESKLSVWIYQIALNTVRNVIKQKSGKTMIEIEENTVSTDNEPDEHMQTGDTRELLDKAIATLPPAWQSVVQLYYFESFAYDEIAQITGYPIGTVKTYLFRAKEKLRMFLQPYEDEL